MASTSQRPLLLLLLLVALLTLSLLAISATASRPCKTLFVSSYSFSLRRLPSSSSSSGFVTVITEIGQVRPVHLHPARFDDVFVPQHHHHHHDAGEKRTQTAPLFPFIGTASSSSSYDLSSLRDRTKDILSVVVSLLFGVGCGALTAATMYLAWSVFISRHDSGSSSFDDDSKDLSPIKIGYVKIPEVTADSVSPPPSTVKEAAAAAV